MAAFVVPSALAEKTERPALPAKITQASSVYLDWVCPRGLAVAQDTAVQQLQGWGRFQISQQRWESDLIFLFSGNPYPGDYITRDGPDQHAHACRALRSLPRLASSGIHAVSRRLATAAVSDHGDLQVVRDADDVLRIVSTK